MNKSLFKIFLNLCFIMMYFLLHEKSTYWQQEKLNFGETKTLNTKQGVLYKHKFISSG